MKISSLLKIPSSSIVIFCLFAFMVTPCLLNPARANGASDKKPFETVTFGAHFIAGSADDTFEQFWKPTSGGRFELATPFYAGVLQAGVHLFNNDNVTDDLLSFSTAFLYLGWGYEWRLPLNVRWLAGVQVGGSLMDTDDPNLPEEGQKESELGFGLQTRFDYPLGRGWSVLVTGDYRRIYTQKRINYLFVGGGVSYTFESPNWLKEFLE